MNRMGRYRRELTVWAAYMALLVALAVWAPRFFEAGQLRSTLVVQARLLVCAIGMMLVILSREIDVSVGSQFSICGVTAAWLAAAGCPLIVSALGAIGAGALFGAVNGWLVAVRRLPSIVATLATMVIGRESLRWIREGEFVRNVPASFQWFGLSQTQGQCAILLLAGVTFVLFAWGLDRVSAGRAVYAAGSEPEAARLAGLNPNRVVFWNFVMAGALTGFAALLNAVRFTDADPNAGLGFEMQVIAAVVVGGVSVAGGRGRPWGVLAGVLLLSTMNPALVFLKIPTPWEKAIQGLILLASVATDALPRRRTGTA